MTVVLLERMTSTAKIKKKGGNFRCTYRTPTIEDGVPLKQLKKVLTIKAREQMERKYDSGLLSTPRK